MRRIAWFTGWLLIVGSHGAAAESLREQLQLAADTLGTKYLAFRTNIVASGTNVVSELKRIVSTTNELWQIRLMAGICMERIERGRDLQAFIDKDWRTDPEYDKQWEMLRGGPGSGDLGKLVLRRYKEQGFWHYYMETIWKNTLEHSRKVHVNEDFWRRIARYALMDSPQFEFLIPVLAERVKKDPGFKSYETINEFSLLMGHASRTELPLILEMLPQLPMPDRRLEVDMVVGLVQRIAASEDVPQIEAFYRGRNQEVPEKVLAVLKKLRPEQPLKQ